MCAAIVSVLERSLRSCCQKEFQVCGYQFLNGLAEGSLVSWKRTCLIKLVQVERKIGSTGLLRHGGDQRAPGRSSGHVYVVPRSWHQTLAARLSIAAKAQLFPSELCCQNRASSWG